jgi:hypothetical protein
MLQGATQGRFFDWRDVDVNTVAAVVPLGLGARAGLGWKKLYFCSDKQRTASRRCSGA